MYIDKCCKGNILLGDFYYKRLEFGWLQNSRVIIKVMGQSQQWIVEYLINFQKLNSTPKF